MNRLDSSWWTQTLADLAETVAAPRAHVAGRLSALFARVVAHRSLIVLVADPTGGWRASAGEPGFVDRVPFLELDLLRRSLRPGSTRRTMMATPEVPALQVLAANGALLVLADPDADDHDDELVLALWNVVALSLQETADVASPGYLQLARETSGIRMEALTELADEYSTTLESVLAALRSKTLDDRSARQRATGLAAEGLVQLRTASDRVRTVTEEAVTTAFERLRDDLRPLVRYRELDVQFVEPPVDGRPLPSEVAHGARAVVRGSILALADRPDVSRVRVQWDCDGTNLLINMRDDGPGDLSEASTQLQLVHERVRAMNGQLDVEATAGWGTEMAIVIPLDPPHAATPIGWDLRPRELDVLQLLVAGRRNRAIADELEISENTVKFHVARIFRKLGVQSRAEATALVLERAPQWGMAPGEPLRPRVRPAVTDQATG